MISFVWNIEKDKKIGKSTCGKYVIEIIKEKSKNDDFFSYSITENGQTTHKSRFLHKNMDEAKRNAITLLSVKYAII